MSDGPNASTADGTTRDGELALLVVSVGNTNAAASLADGSTLDKPRQVPLDDLGTAVDAIAALAGELAERGSADRRAIVVASTNGPATTGLIDTLTTRTDIEIYRVGRDVPIPLRHALSHEAIERTGEDRLLNAVSAFEAAKQAVVVVDAGTAITVDFIDGQGVFQGGAIAAGAATGLRALRDMTASLPDLKPTPPDDEPFGRDTRQAMLHGMKFGAQGLVRRLVERYAMAYDAYPMVVATGGDAAMLFDDDELIDRVVPHLTLRGIALSCVKALGDGGDRRDVRG
jgi:type III pantothenate kinase